MRIAVVGSKEINNCDIDKFIPKDMTLLISGGEKGVDVLAEKYADNFGIPKLIFKLDYKNHGERAFLTRTELITEYADLIIAVWDGLSRGTKFVIDYAKGIGKAVDVYIVGKDGCIRAPAKLS